MIPLGQDQSILDSAQVDLRGDHRLAAVRRDTGGRREPYGPAGRHRSARSERCDRIVPPFGDHGDGVCYETLRAVEPPRPANPLRFVGEPLRAFQADNRAVSCHGPSRFFASSFEKSGALPSQEHGTHDFDAEKQSLKLTVPLPLIAQEPL